MLLHARRRQDAPGHRPGDPGLPSPSSRCGEVFGDDVLAAAVIDRLVDPAEVIALPGDRDLGRVPPASSKDD